MSGGVDSSVAAALLKRAGFNIQGVFMRFWSEGGGDRQNKCCSSEAEDRARQVAQKLGIPFYVFNFKSEFKKRVVDYFLREYKAGRTPNPCVVCNKEIKFGLLMEKALALGADYIATGHYARLKAIKNYSKLLAIARSLEWKLLRGKDPAKDQSYFLWQLKQRQLKHILFPVGDYTKKEVRAMAEEFGLPTAQTKESQEICFVEKTLNEFLQRHLKTKPGPIIDEVGKEIGQHKGLWFYTIGQRKGIELVGIAPYYVVSKDIKKNCLVVSQERKDLDKKELLVKKINWLTGKEPELPLKVKAQIRYWTPAATARVERGKGGYRVVFSKPQRAITPGQSVVLYRGEELLGGGIIE